MAKVSVHDDDIPEDKIVAAVDAAAATIAAWLPKKDAGKLGVHQEFSYSNKHGKFYKIILTDNR